jgi:hypothetical protein
MLRRLIPKGSDTLLATAARHHLGDVARRHRFLDDGALRGLLLDRFQLALEVRTLAVGKLAGALEIAIAVRGGQLPFGGERVGLRTPAMATDISKYPTYH